MQPQFKSVQKIIISSEFMGQRIDNFLFNYLKNIPKTRIYRLLRKGEVRVNKKRVLHHYRLQANDQLRIPPLWQDPVERKPAPSKALVDLLAERILYEDDGLIVLNKPAHLPVHGGSQVKMGVIEALRALYPELSQLELVHRLDAETSGCLLVAKKRSVLRLLHTLMREGKIHKTYLALTRGHWSPSDCQVDLPLLKNTLQSGERKVVVHLEEGKPSLTIFRPIQRFSHATFVEVQLMTGRTHQIRVHAAAKGHPIAGDDKYGDRAFTKEMHSYGLKRLFLHAHILEWTWPDSGQKFSVRAPLDADLENCVDCLSDVGII